MLKGPTAKLRFSDHALECEAIIEPSVVELLHQANAVGWTEEDFCLAIIGLGDRLLMGLAAKPRPCRDVANVVVNLEPKPRAVVSEEFDRGELLSFGRDVTAR